MDFLAIIDNTINQALVYVFLALSVFISLRLIDFPDLSIEGTFPMGAAIAASIAKYSGLMVMTIPVAILFGFIVGMITASLNVYFRLGKLLSGILVAIGLYSVNFRIMGARANLYLTEKENLFSPLRKADISISKYFFDGNVPTILYPASNLVLVAILLIVVIFLYGFLTSEKGSLIRYGRSDNKYFFESIGVNYRLYVILGMGIANALAALSGALVAFQSGSASTTMGFGIILVALVSLVIGEQIMQFFHKDLTDLWPTIVSPVVGAFIYYVIIRFVRWINTLWQSYAGYPDPTDQMQFFNADIRILSVLIMVVIYAVRREKITSLNLPERF